MTEVVVVIGPGSIGQAIARRVSAGKHVVLADLRQANADAAGETLRNAGFDVSTATVDVSSRESVHALVETTVAHGDVTGVIHAAGVSPSQAPPEAILAVDLYGTAVVLDEFGNVIGHGGAGVVIASQSGHRLGALTPEQERRPGNHPSRRAPQSPYAPTRPGHRHPARISARQTQQRLARHGRSRPMGQARRPDQHHQPRHHHHTAGR
jgi:NAD(P)-dependent dehydrogenase (short-subunit alcohol dehydrogenase family)